MTTIGVIKGATRSLDYSSYGLVNVSGSRSKLRVGSRPCKANRTPM